MRILVTGGAGFIGSAVIRYLVNETQHEVINVDCLTYAGNLDSLSSVSSNERYRFYNIDICDNAALEQLFIETTPNAVMHLAAESHVDRSIDGPAAFIQTNIVGTYHLLEVSRQYWLRLSQKDKAAFKFHHISTDEVYGDLDNPDEFFTENTAYAPSSPYSASKASSDHLVRAWFRTYGFPTLVTNCSNNYGPYHFPEKLIPHMILNAMQGKPLPVYGDGQQIRDWLYVEDHARALYHVLIEGNVGQTYNIGGNNEHTNLDVVEHICEILENSGLDKPEGIKNYTDLITYVTDRPGHDRRYAIDATKISTELGWQPSETFESGLEKTVKWYIDNPKWCERVLSGEYKLSRIGQLGENNV